LPSAFPVGKFDRQAASKKAALQQVVVKAAMLDMDLAIAVYIEAGRRDRKQTLERFATDFEKAVGGVVDMVASAATQLESSANHGGDGGAHRRSVEGRRRCFAGRDQNVQAVSVAAEELTSAVTEISRQVSESTRMVGNATTSADEAGTTMNRLSEGAQKIGTIVDLITNIAAQTNLGAQCHHRGGAREMRPRLCRCCTGGEVTRRADREGHG
jgi:methyl-accepting chemotaxis protein